MKNGYTTVRRLKLTPFELRVAIEALNAKRLKRQDLIEVTIPRDADRLSG